MSQSLGWGFIRNGLRWCWRWFEGCNGNVTVWCTERLLRMSASKGVGFTRLSKNLCAFPSIVVSGKRWRGSTFLERRRAVVYVVVCRNGVLKDQVLYLGVVSCLVADCFLERGGIQVDGGKRKPWL
jgi:hypothetical protein